MFGISAKSESAGPLNQRREPQNGHGASPGGSDGSSRSRFPQIGQRFGSPSGVLEDGFIGCSMPPATVGKVCADYGEAAQLSCVYSQSSTLI
jgi:hypothetical protein